MGVHPTDFEGSPPTGTAEISFYTDDLEATVAELRAKGVEFVDEIHDVGYGRATHFSAPGGLRLQLYQPYYSKEG